MRLYITFRKNEGDGSIEAYEVNHDGSLAYVGSEYRTGVIEVDPDKISALFDVNEIPVVNLA